MFMVWKQVKVSQPVAKSMGKKTLSNNEFPLDICTVLIMLCIGYPAKFSYRDMHGCGGASIAVTSRLGKLGKKTNRKMGIYEKTIFFQMIFKLFTGEGEI